MLVPIIPHQSDEAYREVDELLNERLRPACALFEGTKIIVAGGYTEVDGVILSVPSSAGIGG